MRLKKLKIDQDDLSFTFHFSLSRLISQNPEKNEWTIYAKVSNFVFCVTRQENGIYKSNITC